MDEVLEQLELCRRTASRTLSVKTKYEFGQYMTPSSIADYMASLFHFDREEHIRILDPGSGIGSLSIALFEKIIKESPAKYIDWVGYEIDQNLCAYLENYIQQYKEKFETKGIAFLSDLRKVDFIEDTVKKVFINSEAKFNYAILNPPYKKILSQSTHRFLLHKLKIETVNLYSAFVALTIELMIDGGQIVAIIPRSFCNGPYYKTFREMILKKTAINQIHLFDSRTKAFQDEHVLQENVIICLERGRRQGNVKISTSTDSKFSDYKEFDYPFNSIIHPDDKEKFIHIPTSTKVNLIESATSFSVSLNDLGIEVSTGPIVDFRLKENLRYSPEKNTVPLLYPFNFPNNNIEWPRPKPKKPNYIIQNSETLTKLYPRGFYVVVRRFSSKEEQKRIVASVINPERIETEYIGFENHLNVFHVGKNGLQEYIAYGLAMFLNSTFVDFYFRRFSGHTQVNATDLRLLKYPTIEILIKLGEFIKNCEDSSQQNIDEEIIKYVKEEKNK